MAAFSRAFSRAFNIAALSLSPAYSRDYSPAYDIGFDSESVSAPESSPVTVADPSVVVTGNVTTIYLTGTDTDWDSSTVFRASGNGAFVAGQVVLGPTSAIITLSAGLVNGLMTISNSSDYSTVTISNQTGVRTLAANGPGTSLVIRPGDSRQAYFDSSAVVTVVVPAGGMAYYTLDGTAPSASKAWQRYGGPFTVIASCTIRVLFVGGGSSSYASVTLTLKCCPP